jgi:ribose 5-phosphate isomerase B
MYGVEMKIALGTDHAGYEYKEQIKKHLIERGHEVKDFGTFSAEACDYPDFIHPAALAVGRGECDRAVVLGGSGNGEAIVANKVRGVRCAVCWNEELARLSRAHNDANALSIGARMVPLELALKMIDVWLATPFDGGRHARRIEKLAALDTCAV